MFLQRRDLCGGTLEPGLADISVFTINNTLTPRSTPLFSGAGLGSNSTPTIPMDRGSFAHAPVAFALNRSSSLKPCDTRHSF